MERGFEAPGEVLNWAKQEGEQSVLHVTAKLFHDGLGERALVFALVRLPDASYLRDYKRRTCI